MTDHSIPTRHCCCARCEAFRDDAERRADLDAAVAAAYAMASTMVLAFGGSDLNELADAIRNQPARGATKPDATHRHAKGGLYVALYVATNATNAQDGQQLQLYRHAETGRVFAREASEFAERFTVMAKAPAPREGYETPDPDELGTLRRLAKGVPPDVLADALQDRIHPTSGRLLGASPVPSGPFPPGSVEQRAHAVVAERDAARAQVATLRDALTKAHQYIHGNCTLREAEVAIDAALAEVTP